MVKGLRLILNAVSNSEGEIKLDYALPQDTQTAFDLVLKEIDDGWKYKVTATLMFKGFVKMQENRSKSKLSRSCLLR